MPVTFGREYEWNDVLSTSVRSHRSTTSSRHPGKTFEGTVAVQMTPLVKCSRCGGVSRFGDHPARHFRARRGDAVAWFDCSGRLTELAPLGVL